MFLIIPPQKLTNNLHDALPQKLELGCLIVRSIVCWLKKPGLILNKLIQQFFLKETCFLFEIEIGKQNKQDLCFLSIHQEECGNSGHNSNLLGSIKRFNHKMLTTYYFHCNNQ